MSVIVNRQQLTREQKTKICSDLTIIISYGTGRFEKEEAVQCYYTTTESVRLPLYYASKNFSLTNDNSNHFSSCLCFKGLLRDYQEWIIRDIFALLIKNRSATLTAGTGSGKTLMAIYTAAALRLIPCILLDKKTLIDQWLATVKEFFCTVNGDSPLVWTVDKKPPSCIPDVVICMKERVTKIPEEIRREIGIVIIDESHHFCTPKAMEKIFVFTPKYVLSLTATPNLRGDRFKLMEAITGPERAVYYKKKEIVVHKINTPFTWSRKWNEGIFDYEQVIKDLHFSPERNTMLLNLINNNRHRKLMVLAERVEYVARLYAVLRHYNIPCDYMSGDKNSYHDGNVLIGTRSKIGTGFDDKTKCVNFSGVIIDTVIIFCSYKSLVQLNQNVGRSRSDFPHIYHFVDQDSIISRHWKELSSEYLDPESPIKAKIIDEKPENYSGDLTWPMDVEGKWLVPPLHQDEASFILSSEQEQYKEENKKGKRRIVRRKKK